MAQKILLRRGTKDTVPTLDIGELGFVTNAGEEALYVGSATGNILIAKKSDIPVKTTVSSSATNGYIVVDGVSLKVYDDAALNAALSGKANTGHKHVLADITDLDVSGKANGYVLTYNSTTGKFEAKALPAIGGTGVLSYQTLTDLQAAYPTGTTQPAWVASENAWYYWTTATDTTAPTLTITTGGVFSGTKSVMMSTNETATIYYTLDGSTPTTTSSVYSSALSITATTTLKAFAKDTAGNSSTVQSVTYTLDNTAPTVTVSPVAGTYTSTQSVTLTANETATIYYTLDGTAPTTSSLVYSSAISISNTTTLKYFAKDSVGNASTVQTALFTINTGVPDTTAPVLTITPATTFSDTQTMVMSTNETATIWYTVDNSDPTSSGTRVQYSTPVTLTATTTVKAYAVDTANNASTVQTITYTKQAAIPSGTVLASATFSGGDNASSLGTLDSGQSWIVDGVWGISSGEARVYTAGSNFTSALVDVGVSDNISIESKFSKSNTNMALVFRFTDFNNYFYLNTTATGFILTRRVGGVSTNIKTITVTPPVNGDIVSVELTGSTIVSKINGTTIDTTVDAANSTATKHGMNTTVSTSRTFDDFKVKTL
jgi:hypothetical protein